MTDLQVAFLQDHILGFKFFLGHKLFEFAQVSLELLGIGLSERMQEFEDDVMVFLKTLDRFKF